MTEEEKVAAAAAKAELEKTKVELSQAQHTIIELKKKPNEQRTEENPSTTSKGQTQEADVASLVEKGLEKFKLDQTKDILEDTLAGITDPTERAATLVAYNTRIVKSGFDKRSIIADIAAAQTLANQPKIEKTISELMVAAAAKRTTGGGSAAGQEITPTAPPEAGLGLTSAELKWVDDTVNAMKGKTTRADVIALLMKNRKK